MNLFPTEVRVVEEMREEYEVGEVDQHAENDVFLRLIAKHAILHLNVSVDCNEAPNDHLHQLQCSNRHHHPFGDLELHRSEGIVSVHEGVNCVIHD